MSFTRRFAHTINRLTGSNVTGRKRLPCAPGGFVVSSVAKAVRLREPSLDIVTISANKEKTFRQKRRARH